MKAYPDVRFSGNPSKRNSLRWLVPLLVLFLAFVPAASPAAETKAEAAKQGRLVLLPFAVQTMPPQDHLRSGLANVLATRIADRTGLIPLHGDDKTGGLEALLRKGEQKEAGKILKSMQGDYLLVGSLEQQESSYQIMIHVFSGKKSAAMAAFSRTFATMDRAIPVLDDLSAEIAEKVFNQKSLEEQVDAVADKKGSIGFQTAHPDRIYRESLHGDAKESSMASEIFSILSDRSSNSIAASFHAMDAGDLDADGQEELVLLESGRLRLYRFDESQFRQIAEKNLPSHLGLHAVHLADLDGRRGLEIYVSASNGSLPSSLVLQWDGGSKFNVLDERVPYYLRPDLDSSGNPVLLGQAGGMICRMTVAKDGKTARAEEVQVPNGFDLYDFVRVDLDQDGRREFVGITEENNLLVMDQNGSTLWKSEEIYGASRNSLGTMASKRQADLDRPYDRSRAYLHARIIIAQDQNGDGRPEIIVGRNRVTNVKFFKHLRYFEGSSICALSWDGTQMNRLWETKEIPSYTVDYQMATEAAKPGRFRLFSVESDDSGNPLYFWNAENSVIRVREMAVAGTPKSDSADGGQQ